MMKNTIRFICVFIALGQYCLAQANDDDSSILMYVIMTAPHQQTCSTNNLDLCKNEIECEKVGGYWYNNVCNSAPINITCGNNLLLGYSENLTSWGTFWNYWKGFQTLNAATSGQANCFRINVHGFAPGTAGTHTDTQVGYALYSDNNGEVGTLMLSGYRAHYNWEAIGSGSHTFTFDTVHTTQYLEAGNKYWLMMNCSDRAVYIERQDPYINRPRRGSSVTDIRHPPSGSTFTTRFGDGGYSWSIW